MTLPPVMLLSKFIEPADISTCDLLIHGDTVDWDCISQWFDVDLSMPALMV
jgi:hypothetical protein